MSGLATGFELVISCVSCMLGDPLAAHRTHWMFGMPRAKRFYPEGVPGRLNNRLWWTKCLQLEQHIHTLG